MYGLTGIGFGEAEDIPGTRAVGTIPGPAAPGKKGAGPILPVVIIGMAVAGDRTPSNHLLAKRHQRQFHQLQMLAGERDADDRDKKQRRKHQMNKRRI
jgi:hypothetical protein